MLVINIDLIPGGFEPRRRSIALMRIINMSDLADISDYRIEVVEAANSLAGTPSRTAATMVIGHARYQTVWALVQRAAQEIVNAEFDDL